MEMFSSRFGRLGTYLLRKPTLRECKIVVGSENALVMAWIRVL